MRSWARALGLAIFAVLAAITLAEAQIVEVPAFDVGAAYHYDVAAGSDGQLTFVWWNASGNEPDWRIWTARFDTSGQQTASARVDTVGRAAYPRIAALPGGGYAVAYEYRPRNALRTLHARILDSSGTPISSPAELNAGQYRSGTVAIAGLAQGPAYAWFEYEPWIQLFTAQGVARTAPAKIGVQAGTFYNDAAPLSNGGFAAAWNSIDGATHTRAFDADGVPQSAEITLSPHMLWARLAASPTGGFAVVGANGTNSTELWVGRFDNSGVAQGDPFQVVDVDPLRYPEFDLDFDLYGNLIVVWSAYDPATLRYGEIKAGTVDGATNRLVGQPVTLAPRGSVLRTERLPSGLFAVSWYDDSIVRAEIVSVCGARPPTCGDGSVDPPCEACDDGAANSDTAPDACRTTCHFAGCGDAVVDTNEECDDGGRIAGDGCDANCLVEQCGNGRRESAEGCDDGNLISGDGCDANCSRSACGNGILAGAEECDDGNLGNGDGCDVNCLVEQCGDSRIEGSEECDDGNLVDGDGCDSNCTVSRCGNGILGIDEECDDGNNLNGDGCDQVCLIEQCGNNRREGDEACDDGNLVDGDGCQANCTLTPRIDSVVLPARPVALFLPPTGDSVRKTVRVTIRNGDTVGLQILRLTAIDGSCPAGTVDGGPDFSSSIAGLQDTVALGPGERATADLSLRVTRAAFPGATSASPRRCSLQLAVGPSAPGSVDGNPSNNAVPLALDVYDRGTAGNAPEFYVRSARPLSLRIPPGLLAVQRTVRFKARSSQAGASFTFAVSDGDCPVGTATLMSQSGASAAVQLRASRAFFTTPNPFSPGRCSAVVTATSQGDTDAGNNSTTLTLDVLDENDR